MAQIRRLTEMASGWLMLKEDLNCCITISTLQLFDEDERYFAVLKIALQEMTPLSPEPYEVEMSYR